MVNWKCLVNISVIQNNLIVNLSGLNVHNFWVRKYFNSQLIRTCFDIWDEISLLIWAYLMYMSPDEKFSTTRSEFYPAFTQMIPYQELDKINPVAHSKPGVFVQASSQCLENIHPFPPLPRYLPIKINDLKRRFCKVRWKDSEILSSAVE